MSCVGLEAARDNVVARVYLSSNHKAVIIMGSMSVLSNREKKRMGYENSLFFDMDSYRAYRLLIKSDH